VLNYAHPDGWQALIRSNAEQVLVVVHAFEGDPPPAVELPLPGPCEVTAAFCGTAFDGAAGYRVRGEIFEHRATESYEGAAYLLRRVRS
jgi:hypothetical protein